MKGLSKDLYLKLILHLLIWMLVAILLFIYPSYRYNVPALPGDFVIKQVVHFLLMLVAYYMNAYLLVPKLLLKQHYSLYTLIIGIIMISAGFFMAGVDNILDLPTQMQGIWLKGMEKSYFDRFGLATTVITLGISTSISLITKVNKDNKALLKLERENFSMELSTLKAQIHPHFFFNTINTIYALSYKEADKSRSALSMLSKIMRYSLYETAQPKTNLDKELTFILNYIEVMRLRLPTDTQIDFKYPSPVKPMDLAPMLLIPFIENTFKHGLHEESGGRISIHVEQFDDGIGLKTINSYKEPSDPMEDNPKKHGGIGIQNTIRRLDLVYNGKYDLQIKKHQDRHLFELNFKLQLS